MKELFKTLRLAFYVCALPLVATAIASAHTWVQDDGDNGRIDDLEMVEAQPAVTGLQVDDVVPVHQYLLRIDESGGITGRVVTRQTDGIFGATGMAVTLNRQGVAIASATTTENGQFHLENVPPGSYTFIATSPGSVSTFGVHVVADDSLVPAAEQIQLDVAAASSNINEVRQLLNSEVESSVEYSYVPEPAEMPFQSAATQVAQNSDGSLSGRVVPLAWLESATRYDLTGNDVFLFNTSGLVARVPLATDGGYRIENVAPGIYDFVSFGPHGAAALSIEVSPYDPVAVNREPTPFSLASATTAVYENGVDVVLGEPVAGAPPIVDVQVIVDQPAPGGGFGGGGGGYGGGGYGGGGLGGFGDIIGAALAAWVLTEAIDNNNNDNVIQQPVVLPPVVIPPVFTPF